MSREKTVPRSTYFKYMQDASLPLSLKTRESLKRLRENTEDPEEADEYTTQKKTFPGLADGTC